MTRVIKLYNRIPGFLKNRYALVIYAFVIWMCFFDSNNIFYRLRISNELQDAQNQMAYYEHEMKRIEGKLKQLFKNDETLIRFAREAYFMKRPDEDVFVFVSLGEFKREQ